MSTSVSSVTSHFPSPQNGFTTTLASTISSAATTVALNSVAGYTNGQVAVFVVDPTDATKKQTFTGIVDTSGVQITSVVWTAGTNQAHTGGATVVDYATATHIAMITKGLLVEHTQAGRHAIGSSSSLTSTKVITGLNDTNGNEILDVTATASAVNQAVIANAATGNAPTLSAAGGDTNINLAATGKGTGGFISKQRYKFYGYRSGAWTSSASAVVALDAELYDTNSNFDTGTGRYTAPIDGYYFFSATKTTQQSNGTGYGVQILKNGSTVLQGSVQISGFTSAFSMSCHVSGLISLTAGDYMELFDIGGGSVTGGTGATNTYMCGFFVST